MTLVRNQICSLLIVLGCTAAAVLPAADKYLSTRSSPLLRIKSVDYPEKKSDAFKIALELAADGKTPVAVSQKQFSVYIGAADHPERFFIGDASFAQNAPRVMTVSPDKPLLISVSALKGRGTRYERWSD